MELTLVKKQPEAQSVISFFWKPEPAIAWRPGQFLYYNLQLPKPDPKGNVRHFTISSSPTEEYVQLTTKIGESIFKQTLNSLPIGSVIEGTGPRGDFVLPSPPPTNLQVFLAGGIGITPFRSMIKFATDKNFTTPIHLIYSNSTPQDIVFREELDEFAKKYGHLIISHTITHPEESKTPWTGLTGRINGEMIKSLISDIRLPTSDFWVCGPPSFVAGMQDELQKLGISPERVEIEQFTGY